MATIGASTFVHDVVVAIRDILSTNMTDPNSGPRAANDKFVMTSYPERPNTVWPVVTVRARNVNTFAPTGFRSEVMAFIVPVEIRVWARNMLEKDELTDQVIAQLRTRQIDGTSGTIDSNLFDMELISSVDVDESGKGAIKSRVMIFSYSYIAG